MWLLWSVGRILDSAGPHYRNVPTPSLLDMWADLAKRVIDDSDNERDGERLDALVRELDRARVPHRDRFRRLREVTS